jgi:hypothetical protein
MVLMSTDRDALAVLDAVPGAEPTDDAWEAIGQRRARHLRRRVAVFAIPIAVLLLFTVVLLTRDDPSARTPDVVVGPPTTVAISESDAPVARPMAVPVVDPAITVDVIGSRLLLAAPLSLAGDYYNDVPRVCYPWGGQATCDPNVESTLGLPVVGDRVEWEMPAPSWVNTPAGLQPCAQLGCYIVLTGADNTARATAVLDTLPAEPRPASPMTLDRVDDDGTLHLSIDGLQPDATWMDHRDAVEHAELPAFPFSLCMYSGTGYDCDAFAYDDVVVPVDGGHHELTIPTRRELFTPHGWEDCAQYVCVVQLRRTVGVGIEPGGAIGAYDEFVAQVPYRVSQDTPLRPRPALEFDASQPVRVGDVVTVVLRDPPVNPLRLDLAQCSEAGLGPLEECGFSGPQWNERDDGSLTADVQIYPCNYPSGCYLAVRGAPKGYPSIAHTARLQILEEG